jgi:hypothetical protein
MTAPLTVSLDRLDTATRALQRSVLAGVPARFLVAADRSADVVVVAGGSAGWPAGVARAVDEGARGVVVVGPALVDPHAVRELDAAVSGRCAVAVDSPYATDAAWTAARVDVAADVAGAAVVDSQATVPEGAWAGGPAGEAPAAPQEPLRVALLAQVAVVRPLVGLLDGLRVVHRSPRQYVLVARTSGARVTLSGTASAAAHRALTLDVVGPVRRWQARFDDTAPAIPTVVTAHDAAGARTRPLVWESGRRVTWLRLHDALAGTGSVACSLRDLADDLSVVAPLLHDAVPAAER